MPLSDLSLFVRSTFPGLMQFGYDQRACRARVRGPVDVMLWVERCCRNIRGTSGEYLPPLLGERTGWEHPESGMRNADHGPN